MNDHEWKEYVNTQLALIRNDLGYLKKGFVEKFKSHKNFVLIMFTAIVTIIAAIITRL